MQKRKNNLRENGHVIAIQTGVNAIALMRQKTVQVHSL